MKSITKSRVLLSGALALAALGVVAVLDVGSSTADAAPSASPFAGSYVGADPRGWYSSWPIRISNRGEITGSYTFGTSKGGFSGGINADGSYTFTVTRSGVYDRDPRNGQEREKWSESYTSAGDMASDAVGNIDGTADTGETFSWLRQ